MFGKLKDAMKLMKALGFWNNIRNEVNIVGSKNILTSKTFWFNLLSLGATVGGLLPEAWAVPVVTVANMGLRVISGQPVNIFGDKE